MSRDISPAMRQAWRATPARLLSRRIAVPATLLLAALAASAWAAPPPAEQRRIDAVLAAMAADRQSRFMRAGVAFSGSDAARFLRAKLLAQGAQVQTAEAFIEQIASRSSSTGRPYLVCSADGQRCVESGEHLRALLPPAASR
ncbi:MAG: DUF5329 family protein [Rubrivivax sp.]|nr:DUF5329 family protein [Rubrivivax sp.]